MRVLVTGSDGYIGINLVQLLMGSGHEVVGLDTGFYRSGWLYNGVKKFPTVISKDTRDVTVEDLRGFEAVVHLAELSNDPLGELDHEITELINHRGTVHLAKTAKTAGVNRFVYSSSCSVYGFSPQVSDEQASVNPLTAYSKCKVLNEQALSKMADDSFSPVFLRNATVYGLSPRMRFDLVVNNLSGTAWTTKEIKMISDGSPWRPLVHVQDVCLAMVCALEAPREVVHNQIFNVGDTGANYQIKQIAELIGKAIPGCEVTFGNNEGDKRDYQVNFDKINSQLPGFKCQKTLEQGIQELIKVYQRIDLDKETFESKNYTRLKQVKYLKESGQIDEKFYWKN